MNLEFSSWNFDSIKKMTLAFNGSSCFGHTFMNRASSIPHLCRNTICCGMNTFYSTTYSVSKDLLSTTSEAHGQINRRFFLGF